MDHGRVLGAIRNAEKAAGIHVHVHLSRAPFEPDPVRKARQTFRSLMSPPSRSVILHVNLKKRKFAIVHGDALDGPEGDLWRQLARSLEEDLRSTHYENALVIAIRTLTAAFAGKHEQASPDHF